MLSIWFATYILSALLLAVLFTPSIQVSRFEVPAYEVSLTSVYDAAVNLDPGTLLGFALFSLTVLALLLIGSLLSVSSSVTIC